MKVLLDTHVLLWWLHDASRLRPETRDLMAAEANELLWSAASTWELAIKAQLGKVRLDEPLPTFITRMILTQGLTALPVHHSHASHVAELPAMHRDPFDRLLVAQAVVEGVPLLTADRQLAAYGIEILPA